MPPVAGTTWPATCSIWASSPLFLPCRLPPAGTTRTACLLLCRPPERAVSCLPIILPMQSLQVATPLHGPQTTNLLVLYRPPKAGDVIIFHPAKGAIPEERPWFQEAPVFIKRVVAVGGDQLEVNEGGLSMWAARLKEPAVVI